MARGLTCRVATPQTPWEGGLYKCTLHFSERYPTAAPAAKFTPPVFHPNVSVHGPASLRCWQTARDRMYVLYGRSPGIHVGMFASAC